MTYRFMEHGTRRSLRPKLLGSLVDRLVAPVAFSRDSGPVFLIRQRGGRERNYFRGSRPSADRSSRMIRTIFRATLLGIDLSGHNASGQDARETRAATPVVGNQPHQRERQPSFNRPPVGAVLPRCVLRPPGQGPHPGNEWTNSLTKVTPQCNTRSGWTKPGACSCSYLAWPPGSSYAATAWFRLRQATQSGTFRGRFHHPFQRGARCLQWGRPSSIAQPLVSSSTCFTSYGNQIPIVAAKCVPEGLPARFQTGTNNFTVSHPYVGEQGMRLIALAGPFRTFEAANARFGLELDQPVVATN